MKLSGSALLASLTLLSGCAARPNNRFRAQDESDPINQNSRVTAFVNTDEGLKVQCWEIGDFLPDSKAKRAGGSKGAMRATRLAGNIQITLFSFAPSVTLFSFDADIHSNAIDFRAKPNLFTVKDGLIFIEAYGADDAMAQSDGSSQYVFADVNGDDWFYFEDTSTEDLKESCAKTKTASTFTARTISGSDTTLVNFAYDKTPKHRVLHEGRCNFAGLTPISDALRDDADFKEFRVQQELR